MAHVHRPSCGDNDFYPMNFEQPTFSGQYGVINPSLSQSSNHGRHQIISERVSTTGHYTRRPVSNDRFQYTPSKPATRPASISVPSELSTPALGQFSNTSTHFPGFFDSPNNTVPRDSPATPPSAYLAEFNNFHDLGCFQQDASKSVQAAPPPFPHNMQFNTTPCTHDGDYIEGASTSSTLPTAWALIPSSTSSLGSSVHSVAGTPFPTGYTRQASNKQSSMQQGTLKMPRVMRTPPRNKGKNQHPYGRKSQPRSTTPDPVHEPDRGEDGIIKCQCGKEFGGRPKSARSNLKRHAGEQANPRRFKCPFAGCNYACARKENLSSHERKKHQAG